MNFQTIFMPKVILSLLARNLSQKSWSLETILICFSRESKSPQLHHHFTVELHSNVLIEFFALFCPLKSFDFLRKTLRTEQKRLGEKKRKKFYESLHILMSRIFPHFIEDFPKKDVRKRNFATEVSSLFHQTSH